MAIAQRTVTALLVGKQDGCLPKLKKCLEDLGVKTTQVELSNQVRGRLQAPDAPEVVFAATAPADNTWSEVVAAARDSGQQPVIVASRVVDVAKYLDALEHGAFDFVVPPFQPRDLRHVVDCAISSNQAWNHYQPISGAGGGEGSEHRDESNYTEAWSARDAEGRGQTCRALGQ